MKSYRIAVAGCGPAGLAAAILLHQAGHQVAVFERFDEPRPTGSGLMLQPTGLAVLQVLGLDKSVRAAGASIDRLLGRSASSGRIVLDVRYSWLGARAPHAIGIHRSTLFEILFDAACKEGVRIVGGREIRGSLLGPDSRCLIFKDGDRSGGFDLVVDAAGMRTPLAKPCGKALKYGALWATVVWPDIPGLNEAALEQRYRASNIMVGLMPTGQMNASSPRQGTFFWSMRSDQLQAWRERDLGNWKDEVSAIWPALGTVLNQFSRHDQLTYAQYSQRTLSSPVEERLIHVGDAWHSTSPQLGQGANMALLDVYALALSLQREPDLQKALSAAVRLRSSHVKLYQFLSRSLTPFYQSDSRVLPAVRDFFVAYLARLWPATWIQAAMVSGLLGQPLRKLGLSSN